MGSSTQSMVGKNNHLGQFYYVYILECADKSLYTGYTTDLKKRLKDHNESKSGARYTKSRRPVILKYSEKTGSLSKALKREAEIKSWTRKAKLAFINSI